MMGTRSEMRRPWGAECLVVISELRTNLHVQGSNNQEYVELERVCATGVLRKNTNLFDHFKLIQIRTKTKEIVRFCHIPGSMNYVGRSPSNPLILVGNSATTNANIDFNSPQCISTPVPATAYSDLTESFSYVLLFHKGSTFFDILMPRVFPGDALPRAVKIDPYHEKAFKDSIQDLVVYGLQKPPPAS